MDATAIVLFRIHVIMDQVNDLLLPLVGDTDASMETSALAALALGLTHVASAQEDAVEAIL